MNQLRYLLTLIIITGLFSCESQKKVSDVIYDKYSEQEGFSMIALPPNFVDKFIKDSQAEQKELLSQIRDLRVMTFSDKIEGKSGKSAYEDVNDLLNKRNFEELMSINKDGSKVTVKIKQNNDVVREMHVLVKGEDNFFIASLVGRIDLNTINKAMEEMDFSNFGDLKGFTDDFNFDDFKFAF